MVEWEGSEGGKGLPLGAQGTVGLGAAGLCEAGEVPPAHFVVQHSLSKWKRTELKKMDGRWGKWGMECVWKW